MTFLELKTLLIASSLLGGGAIAGANGLDADAVAAVYEAASGAPEVVAVEAPESSTADIDMELEVEVAVESAAQESAQAPLQEATAEEAPEATTDSAPHPGRRVRGANGQGAVHRSERATAAHEHADARSPLSNPGSAHRNEHATAALTRAAERSASVSSRGPAGRGAANQDRGQGRGQGPRS